MTLHVRPYGRINYGAGDRTPHLVRMRRASERCVHLQVATVGVATHAVLLVLVANGKLAQVAASGGLASRSRVSAFREVANAIRAYTR